MPIKKANEKSAGRMEAITFEVLGEPASKANSRRVVKFGGTSRLIKSAKALSYSDTFRQQCPDLDIMFTEDVSVEIDINYASRRPDLCEDLILDLMQGLIYKNDRQVKFKLVRWMGVDKDNPRSIITVRVARPDDFVRRNHPLRR